MFKMFKNNPLPGRNTGYSGNLEQPGKFGTAKVRQININAKKCDNVE